MQQHWLSSLSFLHASLTSLKMFCLLFPLLQGLPAQHDQRSTRRPPHFSFHFFFCLCSTSCLLFLLLSSTFPSLSSPTNSFFRCSLPLTPPPPPSHASPPPSPPLRSKVKIEWEWMSPVEIPYENVRSSQLLISWDIYIGISCGEEKHEQCCT